MITIPSTLPHLKLQPADAQLEPRREPEPIEYIAEIMDPETGETMILENIWTIRGEIGEVSLARETAGAFGCEVLQVWPASQPKPGTVQTRTYWVQLEKPEVDPELGEVYVTKTVDLTIQAGFLPNQGGGEISRLHVLVARQLPGWSVVNMAPADQDAEEF